MTCNGVSYGMIYHHFDEIIRVVGLIFVDCNGATTVVRGRNVGTLSSRVFKVIDGGTDDGKQSSSRRHFEPTRGTVKGREDENEGGDRRVKV